MCLFQEEAAGNEARLSLFPSESHYLRPAFFYLITDVEEFVKDQTKAKVRAESFIGAVRCLILQSTVVSVLYGDDVCMQEPPSALPPVLLHRSLRVVSFLL